MHYLRKLLLAALATTAVVLPAPSALATVEVTDEATAAHCPAVSLSGHTVSGGCLVDVVTDSPLLLRGHFAGVEFNKYQCDEVTFSLRLDEEGSGYAVAQNVDGCVESPCMEDTAAEPWPVTTAEAGGGETLRLSYCLGPGDTCTINIPLRTTGDHDYELGTKVGGVVQEIPGEGLVNNRCETVAHWTFADTASSVEITHL